MCHAIFLYFNLIVIFWFVERYYNIGTAVNETFRVNVKLLWYYLNYQESKNKNGLQNSETSNLIRSLVDENINLR